MKKKCNHSFEAVSDDVIVSQDALVAFCNQASVMPWVAVDTEFERTRTYYPRLCLVQMSSLGQTVCIDPLAGLDLSPLRSLMLQPDVVKVLHAARQDLEVLYRALNLLPTPLFDTQIAAQFCGYGEQPGYADLVRKICDVDLHKQHTRAAWCRRPLKTEEIQYALDDARYLGPIYLYLKHQLERCGREKWLSEDCEKLTKPEFLEEAESAAVKKIQSGARGLDRECQSVASSLVVWREQMAQARDRPREWIVSSSALLQIASALPRTIDELRIVPDLSQSEVHHWGNVIIQVVIAGCTAAVDYTPLSRSQRPSISERESEKLLWSRLKQLCLEAGIPTAVVARRDEIRRLALGAKDLAIFQGWRAPFAGLELKELAAREGLSPTC